VWVKLLCFRSAVYICMHHNRISCTKFVCTALRQGFCKNSEFLLECIARECTLFALRYWLYLYSFYCYYYYYYYWFNGYRIGSIFVRGWPAQVLTIIIIIIIVIQYGCLLSQAFLPGTSFEPAVIPTAQASSFTLQYFPYYVWCSKYSCLL